MAQKTAWSKSEIFSKRYFAVQIPYRHLILKSGTGSSGQDFGTYSGLNGQFVIFWF